MGPERRGAHSLLVKKLCFRFRKRFSFERIGDGDCEPMQRLRLHRLLLRARQTHAVL